MRKLAVSLLAVVITISITTPAGAIVLNTHSEEMYAKSPCHRAGIVDIYFSATDMDIIYNYLNDVPDDAGPSSKYVLLRFTLSGTDIDPTVDSPTLCNPVAYDDDGNTTPDGNDDAQGLHCGRHWDGHRARHLLQLPEVASSRTEPRRARH